MEPPLPWDTQSYCPCYIKICVLLLFIDILNSLQNLHKPQPYPPSEKIYTTYNYLNGWAYAFALWSGMMGCAAILSLDLDTVIPLCMGTWPFLSSKSRPSVNTIFFFLNGRNLILVQITGSMLCLSNIQPLINQLDCYFQLSICLSNIQPIINRFNWYFQIVHTLFSVTG